MEHPFILFMVSVFACYLYAFISGFTDAAQAIAEVIGSRSLHPTIAVWMAGFLEIIGALCGTAVALTIGKGIVSLELISLVTVPAAIFGCLFWSLVTYYFGLPVSETHGLVGGIVGAALGVAGTLNVVNWMGLTRIIMAIIAAPLIGFLSGFLLMGLLDRLLYSVSTRYSAPARKIRRTFINLQILASAYLAFSHGLNDAQKPMGILVMALALYYGWKELNVPLWVIISVGFTAGLGVAYGGWRIIKTLGIRITPLAPEQGFISNFAAGTALQIASYFGIPVSTTHVDASAIIGVGAARRFSRVRWNLTINMFISWIATLPATIVFGWIFAKLLNLIFI
jgi:PiT family inorganic phosphate transporter